MTETTRREFLAAAGSVLATTSAVGAGASEHVEAGASRREALAGSLPPHRPLLLEGIHAYTDRVSVAAGEMIRVHVSSSYSYDLEICRLGIDANSTLRDELLHSFGRSEPNVQPIHPGSYLHVENRLDPKIELASLTMEIWVRRWRTIGRQALISQLDEESTGGFGLFAGEDGSIGFYIKAGAGFREEDVHKTAPGRSRWRSTPRV